MADSQPLAALVQAWRDMIAPLRELLEMPNGLPGASSVDRLKEVPRTADDEAVRQLTAEYEAATLSYREAIDARAAD